MTDYPIISQRSLPKVGRRGPVGIMPARRGASELPLPNAHEAVVYKSGGTYIVDDGRSRMTDDHIVNATNITVVDMREEAPVPVETSIASAGEVEFIVRVTFLCTVKKPEEVADAGLGDITTSLTNYLIQHQPLFHLGEDYHLGQIAVVRRNVTSEVKAFFSVRPPRFRGLDVKLGNIQVLTPDELHKQQRDREMETLLMSEQQQMEHRLAKERAELDEIRRRNEEAFELERRRHAQNLEQMRQQMTQLQEQFQRQLAEQKLTHEQLLRSQNFQHAAGEAERLMKALGADDTQMATVFAGASGARGVAETADALNEERDRRRERDADDALRRETWDREDAQYEREINRENTRMRYEMEVARLKAQAEVVATGINRGLADHRDIEHVTSVLNGVVKSLESAVSGPDQPDAGPGGKAGPERFAGDAGGGTGADSARAKAGDDDFVEAQVVSDDPGSGDDAGLREEDLGR
jgi:hypothetical protein